MTGTPYSTPTFRYSLNAYSGHPASPIVNSFLSFFLKNSACVSPYDTSADPAPCPHKGFSAIDKHSILQMWRRPNAEPGLRRNAPTDKATTMIIIKTKSDLRCPKNSRALNSLADRTIIETARASHAARLNVEGRTRIPRTSVINDNPVMSFSIRE